jgi:protein dithiol:quinone oxidoreductase
MRKFGIVVNRIGPRLVFAAIFVACAALIGTALYMQEYKGMDPCPMCILQRYVFVAIGIVALIAAVHGPRGGAGLKAYAVLIALLAIAGGGVASRQSWLQHNPTKSVSCAASDLDFLLQNFPLSQALPKIFAGTGDCAAVHWRFLGLSIAEWALVWFVIFLGTVVWLAFLRRPR